MLAKKTATNDINIIIPQEATSYVKLPTHMLKWQPYLSPTQFSVLCYLTSRIHKTRHFAYPSTKRAASDCNISENTFLKAIQALEELDLISVDRDYHSNRYFLRPSKTPDFDILKKVSDKIAGKFLKRESQDDMKVKKYSKVIIFSEYQKVSDSEDNTSIIETSPQNMRLKQNLSKTNLLKTQTKQKSSEMNCTLSKTDVVVFHSDLFLDEKDKLLEMKISLSLIKKLSHRFDVTNIKKHIHYTYFRFRKNKVINPGGFLKRSLEEDFDLSEYEKGLDKQNEKAKAALQKEKDKELEDKREKEKRLKNEMAEKRFESLSGKEKVLLFKKARKEFPRASDFLLHSVILGWIGEDGM